MENVTAVYVEDEFLTLNFGVKCSTYTPEFTVTRRSVRDRFYKLLEKKSDQVPPICTEIGSEIRTEHIENNVKPAIHAAACRANHLHNMSQPELKQKSSTMDNKISKSQNTLFRKDWWLHAHCN